MYDTEKGYDSCSKLARIANVTDDMSEEEVYSEIERAIDEIIKRQNYDLWLYLENDVKWVDDGLRKNGSDKERNKGKKILAELLEKYNIADKVKMISGNYEERLDKALEIIKREFYDI